MLPNFLIIGAQKCGTTALYRYLGQHPDIFMSPNKEPNFFSFEHVQVCFRDANGDSSPVNSSSITTPRAYEALFDGWQGEHAIGEASPHYVYSPTAASRIKAYVPDAKLIAVLRNPVDRAYSAFLHALRADREPLPFREALKLEEERIRNNYGLIYHYKTAGLYYTQLERYFSCFPSRQIRVYLYDDFASDPIGLVQDVYDFLGVDPLFTPDISERHNASGLPRSIVMHGIYNFAIKRHASRFIPPSLRRSLPTKQIAEIITRMRTRNLYKPELDPEIADTLKAFFHDDVMKLQDLLRRDLTIWLR